MREDIEQRYRTKVYEKERFTLGVSVIVAELSLPWSMLERKSPRQKACLFRKGKRFLKKRGAEVILPTLACGRLFGLPMGSAEAVKCALSPDEMKVALKVVLTDYHDTPEDNMGWVIDEACSPLCGELLISLCPKVRYVGVVTEQAERAERLEELLFREYGVSLEVCRELPWEKQKRCVIADVDRGRILLDGITVLDGKRMGIDLCGYAVDTSELLKQCPELRSSMNFRGWCMRKSG